MSSETQQLRPLHTPSSSDTRSVHQAPEKQSMDSAPVYLNVYDMQLGEWQVNSYTYCLGMRQESTAQLNY